MPPRLGIRPALGPAPPRANPNGPYACLAGGSILASRLGSSDPGGGALDCYWRPSSTGVEVGPYVDAAADIAITFSTAGVWTLRLRVVSQTTGLEAIATTYVVVTSIAAVASVTVEPTTVTASPGQTALLTATVLDASSNILTDRTVTWTTANGAVATVNPTTGASTILTLVAAGTTTAQAHCEGIDSATVAVTVAGVLPVGTVVVTPGSISGIVGQTVPVTAEVRASGG